MSNVVRSFEQLTPQEQAHAGGKGAALAKLYQAGYPVPDGFVILPEAFADGKLSTAVWGQVLSQLERLGRKEADTSFAVRSSAMSEDSAQASFAGEFETVLNVSTDAETYQAIQTVYDSRNSERVQAYSHAKGMCPEHEIAVIIQRLVRAQSSGVLFTADPITGRRDQAMVSAAWGMGEAIVDGQVTPDTLVVDKATGSLLSRETADKVEMTVLLESGTGRQPVPESMRLTAVLSDSEAADLVALGTDIEALYGMPMDIEWTMTQETSAAEPGSAHSGIRTKRSFSIVQARPITALPEPEPLIPDQWQLPAGGRVAVRNNIVELMAEPLTPLFGTLGLNAVNSSMGRLLSSFFGRSDLMPSEIIITVNKYAYYNGSWSAGQLTRILLRSVSIMKHMFTGAVERWVDEGRPRYIAQVERWQAEDWQSLSATELLAAVSELTEEAIDAYGALVSGVIPAAWITEALFTKLYDKLIKRKLEPEAPTFLLGFDSIPIQAEKSLYDIAQWASARPGLRSYLDSTPAKAIANHLAAGQPLSGVSQEDWREWSSRFEGHLRRFGHLIYNLDFSNSVPADDPAPLLETAKLFARGQGANPHDRQKAAIERREMSTREMFSRLKGRRLKFFNSTLERAQRYAPLREDGLADVGLGYPLLRQMLRELGQRFVSGGLIISPDDIYWLEQAEAELAAGKVDRGEGLSSLDTTVLRRKAAWRTVKKATPPVSLPQRSFPGKGKRKKARSMDRDGHTLKGVAASPGTITAPACVLDGSGDFARMKTGDVLVASITTPAWTPLFARAAAIITDVGGPLSHGSIVAREYGIPAVLGTGSATKRIQNGQVVTVDGSTGLVTLSGNGASSA